MSDVVTGEAVALDLRLAQLPSRLTAAVIDLLVMVVAYALILFLIFEAGLSGADDALIGGIGVSLLVLVFLVYPVAMETLTRGRSLGKMALGLRVVRDDGGPITFRQALVRGLVGLALERPGLFLGTLGPAVGMVVAMFSARGKRIGDMAAGTVVLQERVPSRSLWTPVMPPPLASWAPTLDLTGFDDALALSVRQFLDRAGELVPAAREALAAELVDEVRSRTTPDPPPGTPGWAYLTAILAERRRREEERSLRAAGLPPMPPGWYPGWPIPARGYAGGGAPYGRPGQYAMPTQPGQYGPPGQPGQYAMPGEPGQYGQPGQRGQPGQYGRPSQPAEPGQYAAPGQYGAPGQPAPTGAPGPYAPYGSPGQRGPYVPPNLRPGDDGS
ncbi:MAG TPA: RDD family protein [Mycobacteriales bacterium]